MSWTERPTAHALPDGRLRLVHGPIDLILGADGPDKAVRAAFRRAHEAFEPILPALAAELPRLRAAFGPDPEGDVARTMLRATRPFAPTFVTPMAAVAGAVADHVLAAMLTGDHGLTRAYANNGGDIALWTGAAPYTLAICENPVSGDAGAQAMIGAGDGIGGVATSGWRGRSHSLGIADAVTVLARTAAQADVAATLIANAVDLPGHPAVTREPACEIAPDSDLGDRPVTVDVATLSPAARAHALDRGAAIAQDYLARGLIAGACLACQGERRIIGRGMAPAVQTQDTTELLHA